MFTAKYFADKIVNKSQDICIPNLAINNNQIIVYDDNYKNKLFESIQNILEKEHNIKMSIFDISKIIKKCDIYKGKSIYDPYTATIRHFHLDVKEQLYYKYCKNIDYLLDIGIGKSTDMQFINKIGVKNVIGIEPSVESIQLGKERQLKFNSNSKTNLDIINGFGDEDWTKDIKYNKVLDHIYDVITFQFTIHYMMYNIEILMKNILRVSKKNTKIIITCMNGKLIHKDLNKNGKIEIMNSRKEPIFAIYGQYDFKDNNQIPKQSDILVYFKGSYGVVNGSIEPLVDIDRLIRFFNNNGFSIIEMKDFLSYNSKNKEKMDNIQKKVSYYYTSIVFEKN